MKKGLVIIMSVEKRLVFIYNADSGVVNTVKDWWHKLLRPSTYSCNLCVQTFSAFGMKKDWKEFINKLNVPVEFLKKDKFSLEFLHRDEFKEKYDMPDAKFPSAYLHSDSKLRLFISQDEMNSVNSLDELMELMNQKIKEEGL